MTENLDYWRLLAGLGLFLFGMRQLETALKQLSNKRFQLMLRNATRHPIQSVFMGTLLTSIVQSSSLVGLIVLAFVGAGIIPLANAIGIVLGSNLGTTITGWVVVTLGFKFQLTAFIYPMLGLSSLGFGLFKGYWKSIALLFFGLALLLMGLDFMKSSADMLTEHADIKLLSGYSLIIYLLIGIVFTAIIQSSSAIMMLTLSALNAGIIQLPEAAALVIGADFGTTSTVLIGSLQGAVAKRRLAMAQVIFNLIVDLLAFVSLIPLLHLINLFNISDPLFGLVAFHSLFNLCGILLFMPFIKKFALLLEKWVKTSEDNIELFINNVPSSINFAAVEALSKETRHLIFLVMRLNMRFLQIDSKNIKNSSYISYHPKRFYAVSKNQHYIAIKKLEGSIINYALKTNISEIGGLKPELTLQIIDGFMKAIRSAVYSAKALKDIDNDLDSFMLQDNGVLHKYFQQLKQFSESMYSNIYSLLADDNSNQIFLEELDKFKENSEMFHYEFSHKIYKKMSGIHIKSLDLSTSLNVNKEMETSELALIKALGIFNKAMQDARKFDNTGIHV
jgi:phosphate:Na+ symporter